MSAAVEPVSVAPVRVPAGTTAGAAVREAGLPNRGEPDAIVVVRDAEGKLRDLSWVPDSDAEVVPVAADTEDGRNVIRHSAAHVLAQAVRNCSRPPSSASDRPSPTVSTTTSTCRRPSPPRTSKSSKRSG